MKKLVSTKKSKRYNKKQTKKIDIVEVLTPEEISSIKSIDNERDKAIIELLLNTGLRVTELVNLSYIDVFKDIKKRIAVNSIKIIGKGNKERLIPLNQSAKKAILAIARINKENDIKVTAGTPLIISKKLTRISTRQIERITKKYLNTNPHTLRHTCFTLLKNEGATGEIIQKIAGHTDYNTTIKYYLSISENDLINAIDKIDYKSNDNILTLVKAV